MPTCPKCGAQMTGGAPHGNWSVQYECRRCNVYQPGSVMADGSPAPQPQRPSWFKLHLPDADDDYDPRG